jgi:hypothetical protein
MIIALRPRGYACVLGAASASPISFTMPKSITTARSPPADRDEQHVVGLEIVVHDAVRVRVTRAIQDLPPEHQRAARRERRLAGGRRRERPAGNLLHHEVELPAFDQHVDGGDHVRVIAGDRGPASRWPRARTGASPAT